MQNTTTSTLNGSQLSSSLTSEEKKEIAEITLLKHFNKVSFDNYSFPCFEIRSLPFPPDLCEHSASTNLTVIGQEVHQQIERYLNSIKRLQERQSLDSLEQNLEGMKLGKWIRFVVDSVVLYLQEFRGMSKVLVEYTSTCSILKKRMDAIFIGKQGLVVVDWKYSDSSFNHIIAMNPEHFKDQLFETSKQFNQPNVSILIVSLRRTHNFSIQELTITDLLACVQINSFQPSIIGLKYYILSKSLLKLNQSNPVLQRTQIGNGKQRNEFIFETIQNILKINSKKQIAYYLDLTQLQGEFQPRNKEQFWIIHIILNEIINRHNPKFQNIINHFSIENIKSIFILLYDIFILSMINIISYIHLLFPSVNRNQFFRTINYQSQNNKSKLFIIQKSRHSFEHIHFFTYFHTHFLLLILYQKLYFLIQYFQL